MWTPQPQFPVHHADIDVWRRPAHRERQLLEGIRRRRARRDGELGETPRIDDDVDPEDLPELLQDLRRGGCTAGGERTERRVERLASMTPLGTQVGTEEGHAGAQDRRLHGRHGVSRRRGVEGVEEHELPPASQHRRDHGDATDMRDRPGNRIDVTGPDTKAVCHAKGRGNHRAVGVAHPFRCRGRAGGEVDPAARLVGPGRGGQVRRIARGQTEVGAGRTLECKCQDVEAQCLSDAAGHVAVRVAPPSLGHHQQPRTSGRSDVTHLLLAQDGNDRVLDGPEPRQRGQQDDRFEDGGQLPRDDVAGLHPEARGNTFGGVAQLGRGEGAPPRVSEENPVGMALGGSGDEPPHGRRLREWHCVP